MIYFKSLMPCNNNYTSFTSFACWGPLWGSTQKMFTDFQKVSILFFIILVTTTHCFEHYQNTTILYIADRSFSIYCMYYTSLILFLSDWYHSLIRWLLMTIFLLQSLIISICRIMQTNITYDHIQRSNLLPSDIIRQS